MKDKLGSKGSKVSKGSKEVAKESKGGGKRVELGDLCRVRSSFFFVQGCRLVAKSWKNERLILSTGQYYNQVA